MDKKQNRTHKASTSSPRNQEAVGPGGENTAEKILKKRIIKTTEYLVKWEGYSDKYNTWTAAGDLRCPELIEDFEKKWRKEHEKKNAEAASRAKKRLAESKDKSEDNKKVKITGFDRGLTAEKIIGATDSQGQLMFLVKWKDTDEADLVPASQMNVKCPEVVISYHEECLKWHDYGKGNAQDDKSAPA